MIAPALRAAFGLALIAWSLAPAAAADAPLARTEAIVEGPDNPYVGEMLLLRLRSFIKGNVALQDIRQPDLVNFDWQQFSVDRQVETVINGVTVPGLERVIAIYPRRSGRLTIEPFERRVTLLEGDNIRVERVFASSPIAIEAQPHDGVERAGDWWLPAKSVVVTDAWDPRPDRIGLNDTARRTITIEALGLTADRLPPAPNLRAPGVIVFKGPAERRTIATDAGPLARAVYRFDVRPVSGDPAQMPALHVPWFDVAARRMRDAALPARTVAFIDPTARPAPAHPGDSMMSPKPLLIAAGSFVWAAALVLFVATSPFWQARAALWFGPARGPMGALRRAARRGDAPGLWAAALRLERLAPARWRTVASKPEIAASMAALDAALFAAKAAPAPPLPALARAIAAAWVDAADNASPLRHALAMTDGG